MGQIIIHRNGLLELDSFLLQVNDQIEHLVLDTWVPGTIALDQQGWYLLTADNTTIRLQTGMVARLRQLAP
jgi:Domain of unknown function (DUF5348)